MIVLHHVALRHGNNHHSLCTIDNKLGHIYPLADHISYILILITYAYQWLIIETREQLYPGSLCSGQYIRQHAPARTFKTLGP